MIAHMIFFNVGSYFLIKYMHNGKSYIFGLLSLLWGHSCLLWRPTTVFLFIFMFWPIIFMLIYAEHDYAYTLETRYTVKKKSLLFFSLTAWY